MGLKNTHYTSESTGITLPMAYAILTNLIIEKNNSVRAIFVIQASREATQTYKPLDKVEINFTWDRQSNPAKMAYEKARVDTRIVTKYDEETNSYIDVEEPGLLYGWENDIIATE